MTRNYMYYSGKGRLPMDREEIVEGRHELNLINGRDLELMRSLILDGGKHMSGVESLK